MMMMVHLKIKKHIVYLLTQSTCCNCNGCLNLIHRPPHHHQSTLQVVVYNILPRRKQRINIPSMSAPQQYRWCTNGQKSMPLRRRRISSPIYPAARHYRHRLTCKDLPERCLAGYDAIGPQLEAYEGRRWPSFSRRRGGLPSSLWFVRRRKLASQNFCTQPAQLCKMIRSTNQATIAAILHGEECICMPITAQVRNPHVIRIVHLCLLLQYEYVIDALLQRNVSLYFDFFTFRYIHITLKYQYFS